MRQGKHRTPHARSRPRPRLLRARVLGAATALCVPVALAGGAAPAPAGAAPAPPGPAAPDGAVPPLAGTPPRPGAAAPPALTTTTTGREDDGVLLTTPAPVGGDLAGAAIYDNAGEPVWWKQGPYMNLEPVTFRGAPALSVFDNTDLGGEYLLLDSSYREIASYRMNGHFTDSHEFEISPDGSRVLLLGFSFVTRDLTAYGGKPDAQVIDAVIQEQDAATGEVLFEWSALDHIPLTETQEPLTEALVDPVHANSLAYDTDGDLLMSARHTSTVYKIDRESGAVRWRLGGAASDFAFADPAQRPSYQHDAQRLPDGRLMLFDNGNRSDPQRSRGAFYELDEAAMTARLTDDVQTPEPVFTVFAGSARQTGNGNVLLGYGSSGTMVEFADGEPVFTGTFPQGTYSYRAIRTDWTGTPATRPTVRWREPGTVEMSWNGATEVDAWRIETGASRRTLTTADTVDRAGFVTTAEVAVADGTEVVRVSAVDADGEVLASRTVTADGTG
ncbi:aryl-sulfate sulfotransferase [Streptomyces sp. WMMC500]|uniref:arylsulfotransferase family protein n=1 Tax=Streptomyces sp. WMMC500 TaxID=3015154 RepID=UPI00248B30AE|nr:arylsulfotransferase family protein [Streptomyces sp. WMMC500]WBB61491.1 aryl-sulfate sulfotransferase [Streptomyces sp. WMMC500]